MKRRTRVATFTSLLGLPAAFAVVAVGQWLTGGQLRTLVQPEAALIVFGGTLAALVVSFPVEALRDAARAVRSTLLAPPSSSRELVARFTQYAVRVRRRGTLSLEEELPRIEDAFLSRAIGLVVDAVPASDVRLVLQSASQTIEDTDEDAAQVLEAAAGYAPTLGILGAVLGLIHVMENLAAPSRLGAGIAVAFVATVYGVGSANLIFLPLATRLRGVARARTVGRDIVIEGAVALQQQMHPRLVEAHLDGFLRAAERQRKTAA
jgi:chemotaxis protein MotA